MRIWIRRGWIVGVLFMSSLSLQAKDSIPPRVMENLGRGVVAINRGQDVFVSWRLLGTEPNDLAFNLYRASGKEPAKKLNDRPLIAGTCFVDSSVDLTVDNTYTVRAVHNGVEQPDSVPFTLPANTPARSYLEIPLRKLTYETNTHFTWVGDLDGDGEYDFVVDRLPKDATITKKIEAYRRDGSFLWSLDLGPLSLNPTGVRWNAGASTISHGHNDGVTVYDLDLDGKAEVITIAARGTVFGDGKVLEAQTDDVQQYICVLDGMTGAEKARAEVPRDFASDGPVAGHFGVMYLDGQRPSIVFKAKNRASDGHFNLMVNTWTLENGQLKHNWKWVRTERESVSDYHQIRIVDVNQDGTDELCDGAYVLDNHGKLLYSLKGVIHGDRFHIGDLDPDRPGLEGFGVQQRNPNKLHLYYYDAATGEILRTHYGNELADIGRGTTGDIDPRYRGYEYWAFDGVYNAPTGQKVSETAPWPNFRIWWDGDALSENLNREQITKWNPETGKSDVLLRANLDGAQREWREAPTFYGDILGDWREEVIFEHADGSKLMIYTTPIPTDIRLYTLPHNPEYRASMTVKGYMQSHMVDYYLGEGMNPPSVPHITVTPSNHGR